MVNRIDGNNHYDYAKLNNVGVSDNGEKFSLDYKQEELSPEEKEKQEKSSKTEKNQTQTTERNGVRLELSNRREKAGTNDLQRMEMSKIQAAAKQSSLFESIQLTIASVFQSIKDFFYKIWNEPETSEVMEEDKDLTQSESEKTMEDAVTSHRMEEERIDREIQQYLHSGDLEQVISLLTDNGKKTIARNSTLLTYYDRNGRMVEPNASDRERILHGDRSTLKL